MNAVQEIEARAGASDVNREAWMAERRGGLTATQVRDLALKKIATKKLVDRKLGRVPDEDDLSYVPIIAWGRMREPIIADEIQRRYNLAPESRVFRAADEPRFLASPDGMGLDFDDDALVISEIKTGGPDIAPGADAYVRKGYELQQQWGMRVTGARRSLYAWEERLDGPDGFEPGALRFAWIDYDEKVVARLEKVARQFLTDLDAEAKVPYVEPTVDEAVDTHAVNYLRALELEKEAKALKAPAWAALLEAGVSQTSALARVTFSPASEVEVEDVDYKAAEGAAPELRVAMQTAADAWQEHCQGFVRTKTVMGKPTLRVTAVRTKETTDE